MFVCLKGPPEAFQGLWLFSFGQVSLWIMSSSKLPNLGRANRPTQLGMNPLEAAGLGGGFLN